MTLHKKNTLLSVLLLTAALALVLCGCGKTPSSQETSQPTMNLETTQPFVPETTEPSVAGTTQPTEPVETEPPATYVTAPEFDATYEEWLGAGMIMAASLEYPDLVPLGVYTLTETDLADPSASQGVYLHFTSGGQEMILRSAPLPEQRTESGTRDLYTAQLGYATFDLVVMNPEELTMLKALDLNELAPLMEYSLLVTLHSR